MALSYLYCTINDVKKQLLGLDVSDIPDCLIDAITTQYIPWAQRDVDSYCGTNFDRTVVEEFYNGSGSQTLILRHRPVREVLNAVLYIIPSAQWFQFRRWFYVQNTDTLGINVSRRGGVEPNTLTTIPPYVFPTGLGFSNEDANPINQTATFSDSETQYGKSDLFINTTLGTITIPPRILFLEGQAVPFWNYTFLRGDQNIRMKYVYGYSDPTQPDELTGEATGNLPRELTDATAKLAAKYVLMAKGMFKSSGATSISIDKVTTNYGEMPYGGQIKYLEETAKAILIRYKRRGV